ncbi:uncharacterized protein LOC134204938 [Armigeres subalbatus]|uniref:uncharacterized protein LOC134204938 n=1 Tax=Armigeres subalbatus TaxID=124917 RepID=UPI002ED3B299
MATSDNDAVKDAKNAPTKKKLTRQATKDSTMLEKELEEERKRNASLMIKLKKAKANKRIEKAMGDDSLVGLHSTMRENDSVTAQNSILMTSMSNLSFASLQVPECKPVEGEEDVDKKSYEQWRQLLEASMQLAGVVDEATKMNIFRIKAGHKLLDVLDGTVSSADSPDITTFPYSNATHRLGSFFNSRDYAFMQRQKLRSLIQQSGETDMKYVKRVIAVAKLCDYADANLAEQVADTIQTHAMNRKVREIGRKILRKGGSLSDLLEKVRAAEMEQLNEDMFAATHGTPRAEIAAVTHGQPRGQSPNQNTNALKYHFNTQPRYFGNFRSSRGGRGFDRREFTKNIVQCWRCLSKQHHPSQCHAMDKICHNCGQKGHLVRVCRLCRAQ